MAEAEVVTVSSKGQITIPSKLRRRLKIVKGERFLVVQENSGIKLFPLPKLSKLAGIDADMFRGRKPSKEIEDVRKDWTEEFEKRVQQA